MIPGKAGKRLVVWGALAMLHTTPAAAADEAIQVDTDKISRPGELGLAVHLNYVASGDPATDYPEQEPSLHRLRITPQFSFGLTRRLELGVSLPLAAIGADGAFRVDGAKIGVKWLAPHGTEGFYGGANFEIGRVGRRLDENPWNAEVKLIGGWRRGRWQVGANANFGFVVAGPDPGPVTLDVSAKIGYRASDTVTLGIESYNGLGPVRSPGRLGEQEHATFATVDAEIGTWEFNLGVGKGYGANRDGVIVKLIVGVPLGR